MTEPTIPTVDEVLTTALDSVMPFWTAIGAPMSREVLAGILRPAAEATVCQILVDVACAAEDRETDELARKLLAAWYGGIDSFDEISESGRETWRCVARAARAHLIPEGHRVVGPGDVTTVQVGGAYAARTPRTWDRLADVPDDVERVRNRRDRSFRRSPSGWKVQCTSAECGCGGGWFLASRELVDVYTEVLS